MKVYIKDDFSLDRIVNSGQNFRAAKVSPDTYRFIFGDQILYIAQVNEDEYQVSCTADEWISVWKDYFDLSLNYADIRSKIPEDDVFLQKAAACGRGIRILKQDAWEMLITFIISQRKSIPAIRKAVEILSERYGKRIENGREVLYTFPGVDQLKNVTESDLRGCGLGYRAPYVMDAIEKTASGEIRLDDLHTLEDSELIRQLSLIKGVGIKVANCVALFAYHRIGLAPVDVWIQRIIDQEYGGENPFGKYPGCAGIMQQYMFYYKTGYGNKNKS